MLIYFILKGCITFYRLVQTFLEKLIHCLTNTVLLLRFAAQYFTGRKGSRQHPCFGKLEVALSVKPTEGEELDIERGSKEHRRPVLPAQRAASPAAVPVFGSCPLQLCRRSSGWKVYLLT